MNDIIKVVQALEDILLKGVTKTIENETKEQNEGVTFLSMLLGTLGASLLGDLLTGRGTITPEKGFVRAGDGIKKSFNSTASFNKF